MYAKHEPTDQTRKQVETMAGYGLPQDQIARVMFISETTLKKYYAEQLSRGSALANAQIGQAIFKAAMAGNATLLIFWAKTRMGWKDTININHSNPDGTLRPQVTIDPAKLSDLALLELLSAQRPDQEADSDRPTEH